MKLLLITNRRENSSSKHPERCFGEETRLEGAGTTVMAWLERQNKNYSIELLPNTSSNNSEERINTIQSFLNECLNDEYDCVFYIHGYGKTFKQSIDQAVEIRNRYSNVSVITFSWPSKEQDGIVNIREKYKAVQEVAKASENALKELLNDLREAIKRLDNPQISINLLIHSLGNYLFENLIRRNANFDLTMFDNIIHNQADVNITTHVEWVEKVNPKKKVYITGNKGDVVLMTSQILNTSKDDDRLGDSIHVHTANTDRAANAIYIDFDKAKGIGYEHQLFGLTAVEDNNYIRNFFERVFSGKKALKGESFYWNPELNCYQLIK